MLCYTTRTPSTTSCPKVHMYMIYGDKPVSTPDEDVRAGAAACATGPRQVNPSYSTPGGELASGPTLSRCTADLPDV